MSYETKFVDATSADGLTSKVNAAEKEGWEFMSVKISTSPNSNAAAGPPNCFVIMLATLHRALPTPTTTVGVRTFASP